MLADGRVLFGAIGSSQTAVWDPMNSTWVVAGTAFGTQANTKVGNCNEETWTLLPDGSVLTVEVKTPAAGPSTTPRSRPSATCLRPMSGRQRARCPTC